MARVGFVVLLLSSIFLPKIFAFGLEMIPDEEFTEELLLKPLPDRKVLAHFHFQSRAPPSSSNGRHHRLFPKAIAQLINNFQIQELELSFTQGRWNYEKWGGSDFISTTNAKPPGVELWANFDVSTDQIDPTWRNLTHALSGLFCSSINFLASTTAFAAPKWSFRGNSINSRYAALPREAVCTENLTPWLKLLPCRDKAGLARLLDRPSIYNGYYHSQRLHLLSSKSKGIVLEQTLTVVIQPELKRAPALSDKTPRQPNWSVSSVFKRPIKGKCSLSKSSKVFFEVEEGLATETDGFDLSVSPDRIIRKVDALTGQRYSGFLEYDVSRFNVNSPLDLGLTWKSPLRWSTPQAPFHASRFLTGNGNERGSIAISLRPARKSDKSEDFCRTHVVIFQIVPWYVRVYYHTLKIVVNGKTQILSDLLAKIQVSPSEDKTAPGVLEIMLTVPCTDQSIVLFMEFDKGFLHIDEYPPDANQGFDIPAAVISFPDFHTNVSIIDGSAEKSSLLSKIQERNIVQSYTEILLVPLTTPDFSMPYNVITFTCTVLALYFGSLLNVLRQRVAEEDRLYASAAGKQGLIPRLMSKISSKFYKKKPEPSQGLPSPKGSRKFIED
ncbi:GPI transamidase component Gpi16 subunit family protein isoform X2 [Wolffia australiana]